ncbi:hypothetical protein UFOVP435_5 [uncultured Caudovirales phage]|uniref:Uncharacterized protein n=1 Tax=uncultured Caudovirales phage TaxID=2100421 RepID=A0A6J5M6H1_9CAUD|nr:hypothetical protein UFOVP435_5 [uncultured Caudovirales phage]
MALIDEILKRAGAVGRAGRRMMKAPGSRQHGSALEQPQHLTPLERLQAAYPHLDFEIRTSRRGLGPDTLRIGAGGGSGAEGTMAVSSLTPRTAQLMMNPPRIVDRSALGGAVSRGKQTYAPFDDYLVDEDTLANTGNYSVPGDVATTSEIDSIDLKHGSGLGALAYPAGWEYSAMMGWPNIAHTLTGSNTRRRPINMINAFARGLDFNDVLPHTDQKLQGLPFTQRDLMALHPDTQLGLLMADEWDAVTAKMFGPQANANGWLGGTYDLGSRGEPIPLKRLHSEDAAMQSARRVREWLSNYFDKGGVTLPYGATSLRRSAIVDSVEQSLAHGMPEDEIVDHVGHFHPAVTRNIFKKTGGLVRRLRRTVPQR